MPTESPRSTLMFSAQTQSYKLKIESSESTLLKNVPEKTPKKFPSPKVYNILPKYNTPVRKPVKNPFNERLIEIFNAPTCSPDFNINTQSPQVDNNDFVWTEEDLWRIHPAPIESPQTDLEDNLDEETESLAQEAIERYFQESHNILSPIGSPKSIVYKRGITPDLQTPLGERAMSTPCTRYDSRRVVKTNVSTQTTLSFKCDLPFALLDQFKKYMNVIEDSNCSDNSLSMSTSTLRRKLEFNELQDSSDDDDNRVIHRFSPSDWTPDKLKSASELFSKSPDISPIAEGFDNKISDNNNFNFTREMAIDSITSPIKGDKNELIESVSGDMSIDFAESNSDSSIIIHRRSSQFMTTSGDTGYQTNSLDKVQRLFENDDNYNSIRSYNDNFDPCSSETGITSTPSCKQIL